MLDLRLPWHQLTAVTKKAPKCGKRQGFTSLRSTELVVLSTHYYGDDDDRVDADYDDDDENDNHDDSEDTDKGWGTRMSWSWYWNVCRVGNCKLYLDWNTLTQISW